MIQVSSRLEHLSNRSAQAGTAAPSQVHVATESCGRLVLSAVHSHVQDGECVLGLLSLHNLFKGLFFIFYFFFEQTAGWALLISFLPVSFPSATLPFYWLALHRRNIFKTSTDDILLLMAFYNELFGIVAGNTLAIRRGKVLRWLGIMDKAIYKACYLYYLW